MENCKFSFEDLIVWQKAVEFAEKVMQLTEGMNTDRKHYRVIENCESAAISIASNIAEGNGRRSTKEYIQFLYIARGSLYESITQLIVFHRCNWISASDLQKMKLLSIEIGKMISSLIKALKKA
jgi:four helix bundle protein